MLFILFYFKICFHPNSEPNNCPNEITEIALNEKKLYEKAKNKGNVSVYLDYSNTNFTFDIAKFYCFRIEFIGVGDQKPYFIVNLTDSMNLLNFINTNFTLISQIKQRVKEFYVTDSIFEIKSTFQTDFCECDSCASNSLNIIDADYISLIVSSFDKFRDANITINTFPFVQIETNINSSLSTTKSNDGIYLKTVLANNNTFYFKLPDEPLNYIDHLRPNNQFRETFFFVVDGCVINANELIYGYFDRTWFIIQVNPVPNRTTIIANKDIPAFIYLYDSASIIIKSNCTINAISFIGSSAKINITSPYTDFIIKRIDYEQNSSLHIIDDTQTANFETNALTLFFHYEYQASLFINTSIPLTINGPVIVNQSNLTVTKFKCHDSLTIYAEYNDLSEHGHGRFTVTDSFICNDLRIINLTLDSKIQSESQISDKIQLNSFFPMIQLPNSNNYRDKINDIYVYTKPEDKRFLWTLDQSIIFSDNLILGLEWFAFPNATYKYFCYCTSNCDDTCNSKFENIPTFETVPNISSIDIETNFKYLEKIQIYFDQSMNSQETLSIPLNQFHKFPLHLILNGSDSVPHIQLFMVKDQQISYLIDHLSVSLVFPDEIAGDLKNGIFPKIYAKRMEFYDKSSISSPNPWYINLYNIVEGIILSNSWLDIVPIQLAIEGPQPTILQLSDNLQMIDLKNQSYQFYYRDGRTNSFAYSPPRPNMKFISTSKEFVVRRNESYGNLQKLTLYWQVDDGSVIINSSLYPLSNSIINSIEIPICFTDIKNLNVICNTSLIIINVTDVSTLNIIEPEDFNYPEILFFSNLKVTGNTIIKTNYSTKLIFGRIQISGQANCTFSSLTTSDPKLRVQYVECLPCENSNQTTLYIDTLFYIFHNVSYIKNLYILNVLTVHSDCILVAEKFRFHSEMDVVFKYSIYKAPPHLHLVLEQQNLPNIPRIIIQIIVKGANDTIPIEYSELISGLGDQCQNWLRNISIEPTSVKILTSNNSHVNLTFTTDCKDGSLYLISHAELSEEDKPNLSRLIATVVVLGFLAIGSFIVVSFLVIRELMKQSAQMAIVTDTEKYIEAMMEDF